jgi:hypothetical protein
MGSSIVSMDWSGFAAIATAVAATATAASAVVIAWQAVQTKRSAKAAEDSVEVSRQTLNLAHDERESSEAALAASRTIALEAARERRDARARRLHIDIVAEPQVLSPQVIGDAQTLVPGREFQRSRDDSVRILIRQEIRVLVVGDQRIWISAQNLRNPGLNESSSGWLLEAGHNYAFEFDTDRSLAEWAAIAEDRETTRGMGDYNVATIGVDDNFDDGVIDSYEVWLVGTPIVPVSDKQGAWVINMAKTEYGYPPVVANRRPMKRRYYISKSNNEELSA